MTRIVLPLLLLCTFLFKGAAQDKNIDAQAIAIPAANTTTVDALAAYIKQHFTTDTARIRAIYVWVAHNISYDLARLQAQQNKPNTKPQTVAEVLATRSAVCQGYSDLFVALCKGVGIQAMVVGGYTKMGGKVSPIPHAWVAALLGGEWLLFDPTWGAGYVKDNQYVKWFNNTFYKVPPAKLIADHMPFDPMYQFLSNPLSHKEFIESTPVAQKAVFNYKDSLKAYSQLSADQQLAAELRRLQAAGVQNDQLLQRQQYLQMALQAYASNGAFEDGGKAFNAAIDLYKEYIGHKNKQFSTIPDTDLRQMVDQMEQHIKRARAVLLTAEAKSDAQRQAKTGNIANIDRFWAQLTKEKDFTAQYFAADAAGRRLLFTRR